MPTVRTLATTLLLLAVAGCGKSPAADRDDSALLQSMLAPFAQSAHGKVEDMPAAGTVRASDDAGFLGTSLMVVTKDGKAIKQIRFEQKGAGTTAAIAIAKFGEAVGKAEWIAWEDKVRPDGTYETTMKGWHATKTISGNDRTLVIERAT